MTEEMAVGNFNRTASIGALLMSLSLIGYAIYELVLYPSGGFPTQDFAVIVRGAHILRVGHWLKFGYAIALALLTVGMYARLKDGAPVLAQLAAVAGIGAVALFLASAMIGLRILDVAELTFSTNRVEAEATILMRTVTIAVFAAAIFAGGWFLLLISVACLRTSSLPRSVSLPGVLLGALFVMDFVMPYPLSLIAPLLGIVWAFWTSIVLWREPAGAMALQAAEA
jgi:hypothetical protein